MRNFFSEKFTQHLKNALLKAQERAIFSAFERNGKETPMLNTESKTIIEIKHALDALFEEKGSIASELLRKTKKTALKKKQVLALETERIPRRKIEYKTEAHPLVVKALIKAVQISHQFSHYYVGTEHFLKGILITSEKEANEWMLKNGIYADMHKNLQIVLESTSKFPDLVALFRPEDEIEIKKDKTKEILEYFGTELTSEKAQKTIDPVIGRDKEIDRLINVLCRRHKNNPLLLGEAGVGKTAIVEGLAKKIFYGEAPTALANKKIYSMDLGAIVAGTMYRGEFEARLKQAIEAAEKDGNVILFIDEIHNIIGAGSASGSLDAANILKPSLARGKLSIIGATTLEEYKKYIEADSALERRLQPIRVSEPNMEETKNVILGIKKNYEKFHNVIIDDSAIDAAVSLSARFLTEKLQPDKSIDLIDEASSRVKIEKSNNPLNKAIKNLEAEIARVLAQKQIAVSQERYQDAIALKSREMKLEQDYKALMDSAKFQEKDKAVVLSKHIIEVVSVLTGMPLGAIEQNEKEKLSSLESELKKTIFGQDAAINKIAGLIRRSRANVADPNKPIASFMFLGSSGVGKTETARSLACSLFGKENSLIEVDMSEFSESYSISKLIGSPAGYVGYRDSNKFTDSIKANPYAVLLLDEIEKAHPQVLTLLLQILDKGQIMDSTGRQVNFRNTVIIMTSNLGAESIGSRNKLGFLDSSEEKTYKGNLDQYFKAEFLNRIDSIIFFEALGKESYIKIIEKYLNELNSRLKENSLSIAMSQSAKDFILKNGLDNKTGARSIRRFFQDSIESEIAKMAINGLLGGKNEIFIDSSGQSLLFS